MSIVQIHGHSIHPRFLGKESVVLDLGANHGGFSQQVASKFGCSCRLVEGNAELVGILRKKQLEVVHALIADRNGTASLAVTENDQCSTLLKTVISPVIRREEVRTLTLETLFSELKLETMDLVKMDIEGAEIQTLNACPDAVLCRIGQLAMEFHESLGLTSVKEIEVVSRRLERLGFFWYRGTFSNYEDNLFINRALCRVGKVEMLYNRLVARTWNGVIRLWTRRRNRRRPALT